jgi:hypothetical protein
VILYLFIWVQTVTSIHLDRSFYLEKLKLYIHWTTHNPPKSSGNNRSTFCLWVDYSKCIHTWGCTVFVFGWLAYLIQHNILTVHPWCSRCQFPSFSMVSNIPFCIHTHFMFPFLSGWVLRALLPLGYCDYADLNVGVKISLWDSFFNFFRISSPK